MFMTNARVYADNTAFRLKMVLLVLGALNMALFHLTAGKTAASWEGDRSAPGLGKATAILSLALWIAVIFAGRVIGFTTTGAQARQAAPPAGNFDDFLTGGAAPEAPVGQQSSPSTESGHAVIASDTSSLSIRAIMAAMVDPSGDFLFESVADVADERGVTHKAPRTPQ
jgi:hypothetical protein